QAMRKAICDVTVWHNRCADELQYFSNQRADGFPLASLANLRAAKDYAKHALDMAQHGNLAACQANVDESARFYGLFGADVDAANALNQRNAVAAAEHERAAIEAKAESERFNVTVPVDLHVHPVVNNKTPMRVTRDADGRVQTIEPVP